MERWMFTILVVIAMVAANACTHAVSRRFVLPDEKPHLTIAGWQIVPDVWAFEERIDHDTLDHTYLFYINIQRPRPKSQDTLEEIELLELQKLSVYQHEVARNTVLPLNLSTWVTNSSTSYIKQVFAFGHIDIDPSTSWLTLVVTGTVQPGKHILVGDINDDSVVVLEGNIADTLRIEFQLMQQDSKRLVPFFMRGFR